MFCKLLEILPKYSKQISGYRSTRNYNYGKLRKAITVDTVPRWIWGELSRARVNITLFKAPNC